jgi:hypothetical protein
VGKLELLSKGLHVELNAEQSAKIATKLAELAALEKMTGDEAQEHLDHLKQILTDEQMAAVDAIGLPRGGRGGGGGPMGGGMGAPSAGGPPGAGQMPRPGMMGGPPGGGGPPGAGGPGGSDDANPFVEEANQKRLRGLMGRLQPSAVDAPEAANDPQEPTDPASSDDSESAQP